MSALAEALVAAQRRAIAAMEKAYVAGRLDRDMTIAALDGIGATDAVDRDRLLLALDVIQEWGATLPAEAKPANGDGEPAKANSCRPVTRLSRTPRRRSSPEEHGATGARWHRPSLGRRSSTRS